MALCRSATAPGEGAMRGTVTGLERQQRRKTRVSVFLDDEYAFSLEEITAATLHLGQVLEESDIEDLLRRDGANRAQERALSLRKCGRSRRELEQRLRRAGFDPRRRGRPGRLERSLSMTAPSPASGWSSD